MVWEKRKGEEKKQEQKGEEEGRLDKKKIWDELRGEKK